MSTHKASERLQPTPVLTVPLIVPRIARLAIRMDTTSLTEHMSADITKPQATPLIMTITARLVIETRIPAQLVTQQGTIPLKQATMVVVEQFTQGLVVDNTTTTAMVIKRMCQKDNEKANY